MLLDAYCVYIVSHTTASLLTCAFTPQGHADLSERDDSGDQIVDAQDREPVLGFMACLPEAQWAQVRARTDDWVAKAVSYVDTAWVKRQDVLNREVVLSHRQ